MSEKFYTPVEVAQKVLEKTKELITTHKTEVEKTEACKTEVEKCGEITKNDRLKQFIEKRKAKKAATMEKMLGMNTGAQAPAQPQAPATGNEVQPKPLAPQLNLGAKK